MTKRASQFEEQKTIVRQLASDLGLQPDFFEKLWLEDDWSFVLKLHSLFEAALTDNLVAKLNVPELRPIFARMQLNDLTAGKMAFIKALGLVNKKYRQFLRHLSELRNSVAHDVRHVEFSFSSWQGTLDPNQRRNAIEALCAGLRAEKDRFFAEDAKFAVWVSALCLLSILAVGKEVIELQRQAERDREIEEQINAIFGSA